MKKVLVVIMLVCASFSLQAQDSRAKITELLDSLQLKYAQLESSIRITYDSAKDRQQSLYIYGFTSKYGWSESQWIAIVSPYFFINDEVESEVAMGVLMNSMKVLADRNPFFGIKLDKVTDKSGYYVAFVSVDVNNLSSVTLRNFMEALSVEADKLEKMFSEVDFF